MRASRRVVSLAVAGIAAVAVLPVVAQSAQAGTPTATPYPLGHALAGLPSAYQMVEADGKLFVSAGAGGSSVEVYSTSGVHLKSIVGAGASGLAVSPDGDDVYAALTNSNGILEIDAATLATVGTTPITVDSCPLSLAFAAGRLFYSYGCESSDVTGIASIDPADVAAPVQALALPPQESPLLRGNGSTLVVTDSSANLSSYTAAASGTITLIASASLSESLSDVAISSDGAYVDVVSGWPYNVYSYSVADMQQHLVYPGVAYPQAVAADPTGSYIAGGFKSYDVQVALYGEATGGTVWERYTATTNPSSWDDGASFDAMLPQTMTFSPDGSHLFGLVERENTPGIFLFDSSVSPKRTTATVKVPNVAAGHPHRATVTVNAPAGTVVTFELATNGASPKSIGTAKTNGKGVATKTFSAPYSGKLTAAVAGGPGLLPSERTVAYSVRSKTVAQFVGRHSMRHGVATYTSYRQFGILFKTTPPEAARPNKVAIERKVGRHWLVVGRLTGYSDQVGARIYFKRKPSSGEYRVILSVPSDSFSGGSSATSKPFRI